MALRVVDYAARVAGRWGLRPEPLPDRPKADGQYQHLPLFDGLRGIAVLSVVAVHGVSIARVDGAEIGPWLWPFGAGNLGVDLFFVLSGFLLTRSWYSIRKRRGTILASAREYLRRRALRILPAYWASLAILIPLRVPEFFTSIDGLGKFGLLVTVQQFMVPKLSWEVNAPIWSLTTEIHFYVLLPLILALLVRLGPEKGLASLVVVSLGWRALMSGWSFPGPSDWIFGRVDQFAAGVAAALLLASTEPRAQRLVGALRGRYMGWGVVSLLIVTAFYYGSHFGRYGFDRPALIEVLIHPVIGILLGALFVRLAAAGRSALLETPSLRFVGLISYSLFLWHWPFLLVTRRMGWSLRGPEGLLVFALLVAAAIVFSSISYAFVERPFLMMKSKGSRSRSRLENLARPEGLSALITPETPEA